MVRLRAVVMLLGVAVLTSACTRLLESRTANVLLPADTSGACIVAALDDVFGPGTTRTRAGRDTFIVAAFPWEGYVRALPSANGLQLDIELSRVNRFEDGSASLPVVLARTRATLNESCGS